LHSMRHCKASEADGADARLGGPRLVRCSQIEKQ
jgi:hypothetical protein